jgi:GntR family transcriptional repressor for pyruvate dehydrogenase complex
MPTTDAARRHAPGGRVRDRLVSEMQAWIRRGDLRPGARLPSERRLVALFKASRASVREALRLLERAGLVTSRHGEGTFVAGELAGGAAAPLVDFLVRERERVRDLSEARRMLEPRLAGLAAERATPTDLERLRDARLEDDRQTRSADLEASFDADRSFHAGIAQATHSQTFIMLHGYLSDLVAGLRREAIYHESRRAPTRHTDHRAIYDAIAAGDGAKAAAAMTRHLVNVERILLDALHAYEGLVTHTGADLLTGRGRRR